MTNLPTCVEKFISANDFSHHTVKAIKADLRKFIQWFSTANGERFDATRVTVRDVADFREHLARVRRQSVATVNQSLSLDSSLPWASGAVWCPLRQRS